MRTCSKCGTTDDKVEFRNNRNVCKPCHSDYNKQYKEDHYDKIRNQHKQSYQRDKKKRQAAVKIANERSPEAFIRTLWHNITKKCNYRKVKNGRLNEACLVVEVNYEDLLDLWRDQGETCAITKLPMKHKTGSPYSMSLDRIDSDSGYIPGNVQLVCQWVNRAKNNMPNDEFKAVLDAYFLKRSETKFLDDGVVGD